MTLWWKAALAAAMLALVPAPGAGQEVPAALAGIPNLQIRYYDVRGTTPEAIRKSINAQRPRDPNDGKLVDAIARWRIGYGWRTGGPKECDLAGAKLTYTAEVTLPRLVDEARVPRRVLERWRRYMAGLLEHEAGHLRYPYEHLGDVAAAIRASSCEKAKDAASSAIAAIARRDIEYDRITRHGAAQGATFP